MSSIRGQETKLKLSLELQEGTKQIHREIEKHSFLRRIIHGNLDRSTYRRYLQDLHHIYSTLEAALDAQSMHPLLSQAWSSQLRRTPALQKDLRYFSLNCEEDKQGQSSDSISEAAQCFAARLRHLQYRAPERLLGHLYTRYLGDLSGGQILRSLIVRALSLPEGEGICFYDFSEISDPTLWKQQFRQRIDSVIMSEQQVKEIVDEAQRSFILSGEILSARMRL